LRRTPQMWFNPLMIFAIVQNVLEMVVILAVGLTAISWWQSRKHEKMFGTPRTPHDSPPPAK
jgi:hypothetical protein